jgi:PhnB protein
MMANPGGDAALNPFLIVENAAGFITFVTEVFDVVETLAARTAMPDGRLIHSEVRIGTVNLMVVDRLDGWPLRPGLTGAVPFYGERTLGRLLDPWNTLWWLYAPAPGRPDPLPHWDGGSDVVFRSLDETLRSQPS